MNRLKDRRGTNPPLQAFCEAWEREHLGWRPTDDDIWNAALEAALKALEAPEPAKAIRRLHSHSYLLGIRRKRLRERELARWRELNR
jgi:hypothetical protein